MRSVLPGIVLCFVCAGAHAQGTAAPCGDGVAVTRGDTLSSIAARCDVSEAAILSANPAIDGSGDLQAGQRLRLGADGTSLSTIGQNVAGVAERTGTVLGGLADRVKSGVENTLNENPDFKNRLERFGNRIGITRREVPKPVSVAPVPGRSEPTVTIAASDLPAGQSVSIGAGAPGAAFETLGSAQTGADGTLRADVVVPDWLRTQDRAVFVVSDANGVVARSPRVDPVP